MALDEVVVEPPIRISTCVYTSWSWEEREHQRSLSDQSGVVGSRQMNCFISQYLIAK